MTLKSHTSVYYGFVIAALCNTQDTLLFPSFSFFFFWIWYRPFTIIQTYHWKIWQNFTSVTGTMLGLDAVMWRRVNGTQSFDLTNWNKLIRYSIVWPKLSIDCLAVKHCLMPTLHDKIFSQLYSQNENAFNLEYRFSFFFLFLRFSSCSSFVTGEGFVLGNFQNWGLIPNLVSIRLFYSIWK